MDFKPALAQTLHLTVPAAQHTAFLAFTAALGNSDLTELNRAGARLQLWSDISSAEWTASDFHEHTLGGDVDMSLGLAAVELDARWESVMSLQLSVPLASSRLPSRFEFTYRILYPNGDIKWLGQLGGNGVLVLDRPDADSTLVLREGWAASDSGTMWATRGQPATNVEVLRLVNSFDYTVWTLGAENFYDINDCALALLVPRVDPRAVHLPPTYILSASPNATLRVSPAGVVTFSGAGSLLLTSCPTDANTLADEVREHTSSERVHITACTDTRHLIITTPKGVCPIKAAVIPTAPHQPAQERTRLAVGLGTLAALLPDPAAAHFSVSCPDTSDISFFDAPAGQKTDEISLAVPAAGGRFTLSPAVDLDAGKWQVSVLSDYTTAQPTSERDIDILPTPPPSPQLRPVAHLLSSPSAPSVSSLDDVGIAQESEEEKPNNSALRIHPLAPAPDRITLYLRHIFSLASFILITCLRLFFGRLKGGDTRSEVGGSSTGRGSPELREQDPSEGDESDTPSRAPSCDAESVAAVPPTSDEIDMALTPIETGTRQVGSDQSAGFSALVVEISGGVVVAASRSAMPGGDIAVELNGERIDVKMVKRGDDISLFEFDGGQGGRFKITHT